VNRQVTACRESVGSLAERAASWEETTWFALTAAGGKEPFARLALGALEIVLAGASLNCPAAVAADHIMAGLSGLSVHPDVPAGAPAAEDGLRLVTLSNGSADVADKLLTKAGIRGEFERLLSVEDAPAWKPAPAAYVYAARVGSVPGRADAAGGRAPLGHPRRACAPAGSAAGRRLAPAISPPRPQGTWPGHLGQADSPLRPATFSPTHWGSVLASPAPAWRVGEERTG
jgi:2-haloacid dehalogenase